MNLENNQSGFIALISAIVISLVLITITVILNLSGYFGRYNILDSEYKEVSVGLAGGCVDVVLLEIAKNQSYTVSSDIPISIDGKSCTIKYVSSGITKRILTKGEFNNSYTNFDVTFNTSTGETIWKECAKFQGTTCIN